MTGRPLDVLAAELEKLRLRAGNPSTRDIGDAIQYSHTTVAQLLNGSRCPRKFEMIRRMASYLGGDPEQFWPLWLEALAGEKLVSSRAGDAVTQASGETESGAPQAANVPAGIEDRLQDDAYPPPDDWLGNRGGLRIAGPMLFVGLGGAGCDIGVTLERRLRHHWCGADGNDFCRQTGKEGMLPYQLPSCVQFVYADTNQAELDRTPLRVVPSPAHISAALQTAHYVRALVSPVDNYAELAIRMRLMWPRETTWWLPPAEGQPSGISVSGGVAQMPTVGRAALFGALEHGIAPISSGLSKALGNLSHSGADLRALGGGLIQTITVFVAFSVAGGTGAGMFYDFLHLIAESIHDSTLTVKIYPLVIMPSAFPAGLGGGRAAELNAAQALLDLFHLVDEQNGASREISLTGYEGNPVDPDKAMVTYPHHIRISMRPGMMDTAFVFTRPPNADRNDVHRAISSLMLSMTATRETDDESSFNFSQPAADWLAAGIARHVSSADGIGNRGVSTALVASLESPSDHLAEIIGGRLLREAIDRLSSHGHRPELNGRHRERFMTSASVGFFTEPTSVPPYEPGQVQGARQVSQALADRAEALRRGLDTYRNKVRQDSLKFDPYSAVLETLRSLDPFRAERVVFGYGSAAENGDTQDAYGDRVGAAGILLDYRTEPLKPDSVAEEPPAAVLKDRFLRRQVQWADQLPTQVRHEQDMWYRWRSQSARAAAWREHQRLWQRSLNQVEEDLRRFIQALTDYAQADQSRFGHQLTELNRKRIGLSYLLPTGSIDIEQLYALVRNRLAAALGAPGLPLPNGPEDGIVQGIANLAGGWQGVYAISLEDSPQAAVAALQKLVEAKAKEILQNPVGDQAPLLPRMAELLTVTAGHHGINTLPPEHIDHFRDQLTALVPPGFMPTGDGPLKVVITYPADYRNPRTEVYLRESIVNLPRGPNVAYEMRNTQTDSITVVMFRTAMGLTSVPEARQVFEQWASAQARQNPSDLLRWRQRLGFKFGYLATIESRRVEILHRLLCALWNGKARVEGDLASPTMVTVELDGGLLDLRLSPLEDTSSWASILRAYELYALQGDDTRSLICAQLMREFPAGLGSRPLPPSSLYLMLRDMAARQEARLSEILAHSTGSIHDRAELMHSFWTRTLPAALDYEFVNFDAPAAINLRRMETLTEG